MVSSQLGRPGYEAPGFNALASDFPNHKTFKCNLEVSHSHQDFCAQTRSLAVRRQDEFVYFLICVRVDGDPDNSFMALQIDDYLKRSTTKSGCARSKAEKSHFYNGLSPLLVYDRGPPGRRAIVGIGLTADPFYGSGGIRRVPYVEGLHECAVSCMLTEPESLLLPGFFFAPFLVFF